MGTFFSPSEIVQLGIQIEKNGFSFYTHTATKTKLDKVKQILTYLANEEEKHIQVFEKMLSKIENYEPAESYPGEYFAYLKALSQSHVFTQENAGLTVAEKVKSDRETIDLGIGFEVDSILFYQEMKPLIPQEGREIIESLVTEERKHLIKLAEMKDNLP